MNFCAVAEAARRRGEVAFGYRLHARAKDAGSQYGVVVNPAESETLVFRREDRIIVLAES